jgi:tRNA-binding protein
MNFASIQDFQKLDIRVGKIIEVNNFPEAKKPAYKLTIDLGPEIGTKKSSAQITEHYTKEKLLNQLVICVVNFPPRQIGPFVSEVLTLGVPSENNTVVLVQPQQNVPIGGKLF